MKQLLVLLILWYPHGPEQQFPVPGWGDVWQGPLDCALQPLLWGLRVHLLGHLWGGGPLPPLRASGSFRGAGIHKDTQVGQTLSVDFDFCQWLYIAYRGAQGPEQSGMCSPRHTWSWASASTGGLKQHPNLNSLEDPGALEPPSSASSWGLLGLSWLRPQGPCLNLIPGRPSKGPELSLSSEPPGRTFPTLASHLQPGLMAVDQSC